MSKEQFEHEYDLGKLQVIRPQKRDFQMLVTPSWVTYFSQNAYEDFTSDLVLKFLRDDTLFIDVGAHYGYYTLLAGTKYPKCEIISFEPVPENCEILRRNIKLNQLENVEVYNLALSNKNETRKFNITEVSACCGFDENPITRISRVVDVQAVTLDSLINKAPKVPVIIKVDTEGHEICVLEGMDEILRNAADIKLIVEFNPKCLRSAGCNPSDLLKKILQFGFEIYFINDDKRVINKLAESNIEGWGNYVLEKSSTPGIKTYINILCVKNPVEPNKRLREKVGWKTKTLLINPNVPMLYEFGGHSAFPLGLGYIAAVLEKSYNVKVIDVGAEGLDDDSLIISIIKINPKIVGITSDTLAFQRAIEIATIVKQIDKKIIVVIGGAHSNALPTYPLKFDCFDISVYGEGERTAVELWDRIDKGKSYEDVKGISFRGKGGIVVNPRRELIENLDELPFPARHLFPMDKYRGEIHLSVRPVYPIGTSRGCPFSCAFCSCNVAFGRKYRFRSPKNVVDEIEPLINQYKVKGIYFREDLFTANKQRVIDICDEIGKRGLHFSWECESRVDTIDEEMLQAMKKAGCELIWFGAESGSQRILEYLNKQITLSQVREAFDICQKVGIKAGASFMIGIPGETMDEIQKSIDLAEELKPKLERAWFSIFTAFPTSSLYEFVKENRLYEKEVNHGILIIKTAEFNREILEEVRKYANARVNRSEQPKELLSNSSKKPLVSVYSSGSKRTKIAAITMVYNEALLLPYFLRHYEHLDEIYVLYETDSTDDTLKILKQASNVIIKDSHIEGGLDSIDKVNLTNNTLHTIKADWVYVVDCDEFIFPPQESPDDFLSRQSRGNYNVVRAGMFQVYRHRIDKDLDPSLPPIPQRVHGDPDLFSTVEGPHKARNALYVKPIVVKPSSEIRFRPGNHVVEGDIRVSPELYIGAHWQMADPSIAIDRRIKNKMRMSERNKRLGMGWHYQNVTEEWIRAECDRHLDDPLIDELYLYSDKSFKNYDSLMRSKSNMKHLNPWNHLICFVVPNRITLHSAWYEHIPFAMFLVDLLRPKMIVELGTHYGDSYCAFCQAVKELHLDTACYAVDTWKGDSQSGFYGPKVLADLRAHHDPLYSSFSRLIQSTFDEALEHFDAGTVDLLHIDGYHTYESVRHDFETWLPKMSSHGLVLFHDINVREQDFGIRKFWDEVRLKYLHFEFRHGHGLGVLAVGKVHSKELRELFKLPEEESVRIRDFFFQLGHQFTTMVRNKTMASELENQKRQLQELKANIKSKNAEIHGLDSQIHGLDSQIQQIQQSIPMQLVNRYQKVADKLLPLNARRRRPYELGTTGIRVILNKGWKSFFSAVAAYFQRKGRPR